MDPEIMLLDEQMPAYDVVVTEHLVVDADPAATFEAARDLDFLAVHAPLISAAMFVRGLPDRLSHREQPPPTRLEAARGVGLPTSAAPPPPALRHTASSPATGG